jgi:hypothetical protein
MQISKMLRCWGGVARVFSAVGAEVFPSHFGFPPTAGSGSLSALPPHTPGSGCRIHIAAQQRGSSSKMFGLW